MKDLPKVFANKLDQINDNNRDFVMSKNENKIVEDIDINKKINDIFSSYKYVYKVDVVIITETGEEKKKIIGKKDNNLITMDNELIDINKIKDIKLLN